jgi:hydrogenase maturation protease
MPAPVLIIGIGNEYRSDDGVGLYVARALAARALSGAAVMEQGGDGTALLQAWQGARAVLLVDALASGGRAGTVRRFVAHAEPIPAHFSSSSSHAFGVAEAIELARSLGQLPPSMILYGIVGRRFTAGVGLSLPIERAARTVIERVADEALTLLRQGSPESSADRSDHTGAPLDMPWLL